MNTIGAPAYETAKYLAKFVRALIGKTEYHVKTSAAFAQSLDTLQVSLEMKVVGALASPCSGGFISVCA